MKTKLNTNQFYLTMDGMDLLNRTTTGTRLEFTRVAIGDGVVKDVEEIRRQKALINQKMSTNIDSIKNNENGTCTIDIAYTNRDLDKGFFINEIGVFAQDPIKGEILYFISTSGGNGEFIPAFKDGFLVENTISIDIIIGDVTEVTVLYDDSLVWATKKEINDLAGIGRTDETVKGLADILLKLQLEFAAFKGSSIEGLGKNTFYVAFNDFSEKEEYEGVWDKERGRLGIYPVGGEV